MGAAGSRPSVQAPGTAEEQELVRQLAPRLRSLRAHLRALRLRKLIHKLLAVLLAVDGVGTLEREGLYHPAVLQEALRWVPGGGCEGAGLARRAVLCGGYWAL